MKIMTIAAAAMLAASPLALSAASAQVATADLQGAINQSAAMAAARAQIQTTYKTQIDAASARQNALNAQLKPLADEFQTLRNNPATPPATLQTRYNVIQQRQQAAQDELAKLAAPFERPANYAQEQIADKLDGAVKAAMAAKNVTMLIKPDAVLTVSSPTADLTTDIVAQLNTQVKTVSITPPAGWQPGQPRTAAPTGPGR